MIPTLAFRSSIFRSSKSFVVIRFLSFVKIANGADDFVLLRPGQLGKNRDRDDLARSPLGFWQGAFLVSQVGKTRLEVQRQRIIDRISDLPAIQVRLQLVAPLDP